MRVTIIGGAAGAKLAYNALYEIGVDACFYDCYATEWRRIKPLIFDDLDEAMNWSDGLYFVATGKNVMRERRVNEIERLYGNPPIRVIHPHTAVSRFAEIGEGAFICDSASVGPDAILGKSVVLNERALVPHDCTLDDYCLIAGGVHMAGYVTVGKYAMVGMGATIIPHIAIGEGAMVAAGAVVIKDVAPYTMVAGVPAAYKREWEPE